MAKASAKTAAPAADPASRPVKKGDHVFLVDGSSYIFRAYHALPPLNRKSDGLQVNAVLGFCNMLWKLLRDMKPEEKPTHLAVIFDKSERTFRNELYQDYKAHRPDAPADLIPQFPLIREAVRAFDIPCLEMLGFEADDLIATYAREACAVKADVTIVSSDKDLMQLVTDCVVMYDTMKDKKIGIAEVIEKFGVPPEKVIEVQSLIGDSTDNVPGVPGIGVKTAAQLIGEYGDLETLLARAGEIKQEKRRQSLIDNAEKARISKKLVTLDDKVKLEVPLADLAVHEPDYRNLVAFLKAMEFSALTRRVADFSGLDASAIDPSAAAPPKTDRPALAQSTASTASTAPGLPLTGGGMTIKPRPWTKEPAVAATPQLLATARLDAARNAKVERSRYEIVRSRDRLGAWVARAYESGVVAINIETLGIDPMQAPLCGIALAVGPNEACYIPLAHRKAGDAGGLFGGGLDPDQMSETDALAALQRLLEDPGILKIGQNLKYELQVFAVRGIEMQSHEDTMLMSYVLDAGRFGHSLDALAPRYFNHAAVDYNDVIGTGKAKVGFDSAALERAAPYVAEDADISLRLTGVLKARMIAEHVMTVYETLERPLLPVLARMERRGISVDRQVLSRLSGEFAQRGAALEAEVRVLAGDPDFNPGSPKQLGDILFGKMQLPGGTKTKTGQWSTGARVLDELAEQGVELAQKILDWRQVTKLKSTYTDALPGYINPVTNRVHTNYALAATPTGRLSSSEPNLQNIPIRTDEGRKIRRAFVATPGNKLVSADYSQIELRLLAEIAEVPALRQAFTDSVDIHAMTASEMFGVPVKGMPADVRRRAKAMLYLVKQEDVMRAIFGQSKSWQACDSFFACGTPMTNHENTEWFKHGPDIAKAKELFAKAGYDGKPVVVLQATDHYLANPAGLFAAQWLRQAGINVDLAAMDWGALVTRRAVKKPPAEGGWNIFSTTVTGITFADPIAFTGQAANGDKAWFGWPKDDLQEKLREKWALAPTLDERKQIAKEMQANGWNYVPHLLLGQFFRNSAWRKNITGVIGMPEVVGFWNMEKKA